MSCLDNPDTSAKAKPGRTGATTVLASEAGVPFQPPLAGACGADPVTEWLGLMEVVQMLCPAWPARDQPMRGSHWLL